jgi:dihydroorotate dehydrogenase electron transfer subunit
LHRIFTAKVTDNLPLTKKNYLLTIKPLEPTMEPAPGQFYMIETGDSLDPLLKRPFSYFRKTSEIIQFLYTVRGKGTAKMKALKAGSIIQAIGPLGSGYPSPQKGFIPLLIAGGIGIASLFSLAECCIKKRYLIYGARCKNDLLILNELEQLGGELITCTDDCSFGKEGKVTDILTGFLSSPSHKGSSCIIYACGPMPMLSAVSEIAVANHIKGFVSLEENMACGFGACLGCAVQTKKGYKRVCKEGPVFPIEEIVW